MIKMLKNYIKENPLLYKFLGPIKRSVFSFAINTFVPDDIYIKRQFKKAMGRELDLKNPVTFNEKIQWLKLYWRNPICTMCQDKYAVREFVKNRVGEEVLNKLYAVFDKVDDINLNLLPDSFVLKATHSCGHHILCKNKNEIVWDEAFRMLKKHLKSNFFYVGREWAYKHISPKIVCEAYLSEGGQPPKDYKIWCFNGKPRFISVYQDRFSEMKADFYDLDWNMMDLGRASYARSATSLNKPKHLNQMIECAARLAQGIPFVRVDFYYINGRIYFGEMTFYPSNGIEPFVPSCYDAVLGSYLKLPEKFKVCSASIARSLAEGRTE